MRHWSSYPDDLNAPQPTVSIDAWLDWRDWGFAVWVAKQSHWDATIQIGPFMLTVYWGMKD